MKKSVVYSLFSKIPTLQTDRLTLRRMKPSDAKDMYEYAKRSDVTEYLLWEPHVCLEQTQDYLHFLQTRYRTGDFYDWAVIDKAQNKMIGTCGFANLDFPNNKAEIGYVLNPAFWGQGIAAEAVRVVMEFAFMELNVHRVEARYIAGNERSRRVMEKCGMKFEGIAKSSMYIKGQYRDIGTCAIVFDDYIKSR